MRRGERLVAARSLTSAWTLWIRRSGTRSFSRRGGRHFHEALRSGRQAETNRSSRCPRSRSTYRRGNRVSLHRPRRHSQVVSSERREISALYCRWFSYLTCRLSIPQYAWDAKYRGCDSEMRRVTTSHVSSVTVRPHSALFLNKDTINFLCVLRM